MNNSSQIHLSTEELNYILSPLAIRERAQKIFSLCRSGQTAFAFHAEKLSPCVDYVLKIIAKNYPDLNIPFHSRWGHFRASGVDRTLALDKHLKTCNAHEKARAKLDLVITSVLLDAGSGPDWSYFETQTQKKITRSEGLGVASFHMFCAGVMSSDRSSLRADVKGLQALTEADLNQWFQVSETNPLVGVSGRLQLLNNLSRALENKKIFKDGRPGNILDYLLEKHGNVIPAPAILGAVLEGLGPIWPGRLTSGTTNLGDVWSHPLLGPKGSFASLVPIHKLSQWMTYSLIEPILEAGCAVSDVQGLTGLAEYRNGGLLLDSGVLSLRQPENANKEWRPDSELIIEWRALTVHILDMIGTEVQKALNKSAAEFPLAKVLEGGTWWAGRSWAQEKRAGGGPPLNIKSDGTVF